jgi:hypothetical protein
MGACVVALIICARAQKRGGVQKKITANRDSGQIEASGGRRPAHQRRIAPPRRR